jgi:uncharacterized membrane protein
MSFRKGATVGAVGAGGYLAGRSAIRRFRPATRLAAALRARVRSWIRAWLDRTVRDLEARAERAGPLGLATLAGLRALAEGRSPLRALLSAGWTFLTETLKRIFGWRSTPTTIVERIDVGVPIGLAYDQWTRFQDFPSFMKKVVSVDQESAEKLQWTAKVLWSTRTWEATIVEQVPDKHIIWRSKGSKGHVDGTVSFHALDPDMTRVLVVLEYYPRGLFERVGNLWRAQGRRARLELKHFRRHVMTESALRPDQVRGWRGEIRDGRVVG